MQRDFDVVSSSRQGTLRRAIVIVALLFSFGFLEHSASAAPWPSTNDKVQWKQGQWPRVTPWEVAGSLALTGAGLWFSENVTGVGGTGRTFEVPVLDPGARYLLRGRSTKVQQVFADYSDVGWRMMVFFPYVDVGVAALLHRDFDVAGQMFLMDFQALTMSGFTFLLASRFIGRSRPYKEDCHPESHGTIRYDCIAVGPDNGSFYSGHTAAAFTSAGLTCVHHQHLPLYGGGPVEAWACVWALGVATSTGLFRIIADEHYASDILVGAGVGWFYGYIMPKLLHYKDGKPPPPKERKAGELTWTPSFNALNGGGLLSVGATF